MTGFMSSPRAAGAVALATSLLPVVAGLVASSMLAVDTLRRSPVFCAEGGGCDAVKHTAYAAPLGVPMPVIGVAGFLAIGVAALLPGSRARVAQIALSGVAAMAGVFLFVVQASMGTFCPFCLVADASGVACSLTAAFRAWRLLDAAPPRGLVYGGAAVLAVAALAPMAAGFRMQPAVPRVIREEMAKTPSGEATVVDFVDFECPFCRMTHGALEPLIEAHKGKVRVVRKQVPLSRIHTHALDAARAADCAERLGKGEAMANALFTAPVDDLTREGCERIATSLGLPLAPFRACVSDPKTDESIEADRAEWKAAGGYALPTVWIGGVEIVGAQPPEVLRRAIDDAVARAGG